MVKNAWSWSFLRTTSSCVMKAAYDGYIGCWKTREVEIKRKWYIEAWIVYACVKLLKLFSASGQTNKPPMVWYNVFTNCLHTLLVIDIALKFNKINLKKRICILESNLIMITNFKCSWSKQKIMKNAWHICTRLPLALALLTFWLRWIVK